MKLLECFSLFFPLVSTRCAGRTPFFSRAWWGRIVLLPLFLLGDGQQEPVFYYKIAKLLLQLCFLGRDVAKQILFPCSLYYYVDKKKSNISSNKRLWQEEASLSGPLAPYCASAALHHSFRQAWTASGIPAPPLPQIPEEFLLACSSRKVAAPKRAENQGHAVFSFLYKHGKNGHFLLITNVYITLKLQFKKLCPIYFYQIFGGRYRK